MEKQASSSRVVLARAITVALVLVIGALDAVQLAGPLGLSFPLVRGRLPKLLVPELHQVTRLIDGALEPFKDILKCLLVVSDHQLDYREARVLCMELRKERGREGAIS